MTPEHRAKIAAALRGRQRPPGLMERLHEMHRGRKRTPETRAKMSASKRGKSVGPDVLETLMANVVARHGGWVVPAEHRLWYRKMREAGFTREQCREAIMHEVTL